MTHVVRLVLLAGLLVLTERGLADSGPGMSPRVTSHRDEARSLGLLRERGNDLAPSPLLEQAARTPGASVKLWVFFTDKGLGTQEDLTQALRVFRAGLSEKARARRAGVDANLATDFTDLPVWEGYVDALLRAGFQVRRTSRWMNAASVTTTAGRLHDLERMQFVRYVQPVLTKRAPIPDPDRGDLRPQGELAPQGAAVACTTDVLDPVEAQFYGPSYNQLGQIQVLALHRLGYSGAGVRVMVLDTGFLKSHPAFALTNWIAEWDYVNEDGNTANEAGDVATQHNHGTGVWGVAGGYAPGALIGPAFAAEWVLAKTENVASETTAEEDNYVAALEWADLLGVDVTTASLAYFSFDGGTGYTKSQLDGDTAVITRAVDLAVAKGIACVNAMGNTGPMATTLETPADADSVIAVGAVDSCAVVANFSSRGPTWDGRTKPEIVARGVSTYWARASTGGYIGANGTSLATPLIGGLAVLLKEAHPTWTGYQIRAALMATGTQNGAPDNNYGWGLAQASSALSHGGVPEPPRMTLPFKLLTPASGAILTDVTPTLRWGKSKAVMPGDHASHRLLLDDNPSFTSPETVQVGPDTTYTFPVGLPPGTQRWWKVEALGNLGYVRRSMNTHSFTISNTVAVIPEPATPRLMLGAAAPNPMYGTTAFEVQVPEGERARVEVISVSGRVVRRFDMVGDGAVHSIGWDGTDTAGHRVPAGMYVYRLSGARAVSLPARKILVLSR